jgi:hypothetical protein
LASSAIPALLTLVMHFAKPVLKSFSLFAIGRRVGQVLTNVVFPVPEPLAVLPTLPIVARRLPGLWAEAGYPWDRDLNVGLSWWRALSMCSRLRPCAGER